MIGWSPVRPSLPGCPHRRLRRLLARELPHGVALLDASTLRPWASAKFVGARHLFPCSVAADAGAHLASTMHAHPGAVEVRMPGHKMGRAECGARGCQYVVLRLAGVYYKQKHKTKQ